MRRDTMTWSLTVPQETQEKLTSIQTSPIAKTGATTKETSWTSSMIQNSANGGIEAISASGEAETTLANEEIEMILVSGEEEMTTVSEGTILANVGVRQTTVRDGIGECPRRRLDENVPEVLSEGMIPDLQARRAVVNGRKHHHLNGGRGHHLHRRHGVNGQKHRPNGERGRLPHLNAVNRPLHRRLPAVIAHPRLNERTRDARKRKRLTMTRRRGS